MGGGYATHWHQPLLPLGPLPINLGDRLLLQVSISDAAGQKLNFTLQPKEPGRGREASDGESVGKCKGAKVGGELQLLFFSSVILVI